MIHSVPAVAWHHVRQTEFIQHIVKEPDLRLIADLYCDLVLFERAARRPDIQPDDLGVGAEIPIPHLQRPALAAADFPEHDGAVDGRSAARTPENSTSICE